jgi:5-methylthioadenosine/S-adenosylhomocysteine deaminase
MLIGTKAAPLPSLIAAGARIGLGTDQPNDGHDFFAVMKGTVLQQRAQHQSTEFGSPELMLELATIGGARAMHLEAEIGSIEAGKRADLVVVDARRPTLNPGVSAVSNLVYAASPGDVESVFVDGVEIVRHGVPLAWEIEDTVDTVNRVVECALRRHGLAPLLVTSWPVVDGGGTVERGRE